MRLFYIADPVDTHSQRWLSYFVHRGHEVHLVPTRQGRYSLEGVRVHRAFPIVKIKKIGFMERLLRIKIMLRQMKPDILHAHYAVYNGWLGALSGFQPLVVTIWGSDIYIDAEKTPWNYMLTRFTFNRTQLITSESADALKRASAIAGRSRAKYAVISGGVDLQRFHPGLYGQLLKSRLRLEGSSIVLSPRKTGPLYNTDMIIKAIPLVLTRVPEARFVFMNCEGSRKEELRILAESLGVLEYCRWIEEVDYEDMPSFYSIADVVISIPSSDNVSIAVLEAMACGVPAVATDLPSNREWITHEENGLLVPPKDPGILSAAIVRLLRDSHLRQESTARNLSLVKEKGDYFREMAKMEKLYEELVGR